MPRFVFFLVLFATSATAGNLFEPLSSEHGATARGITGSRVGVNADALLSSEPFVTLDYASYPLHGIAVEWRAWADFKAEFAIGSATFVSVLTKHEGYFAGVLYLPQGLAYELIPDAGGHTVRRASAAPFRCEVVSTGPAGAATASAATLPPARRRAVRSPTQNFIDLAEFWTPRAETMVGGRGPIEAIIRNAVDILNADTRQSGISNFTFRLVHVGVVDLVEDRNASEDLSNLSLNQNVAQVRANVGADLAGVWSDSVSAVAYAPQWRSAFNRKNSFHLMSIRYGPASHTYSHEVFHNFGGQHNEGADEYLTTGVVDEYPFARDKCTENWATILAYPSCVPVGVQIPTIPYITNPDLEYEGVSLGERGRMDNARMVRLSMPWIAEYYPSVEP